MPRRPPFNFEQQWLLGLIVDRVAASENRLAGVFTLLVHLATAG